MPLTFAPVPSEPTQKSPLQHEIDLDAALMEAANTLSVANQRLVPGLEAESLDDGWDDWINGSLGPIHSRGMEDTGEVDMETLLATIGGSSGWLNAMVETDPNVGQQPGHQHAHHGHRAHPPINRTNTSNRINRTMPRTNTNSRELTRGTRGTRDMRFELRVCSVLYRHTSVFLRLRLWAGQGALAGFGRVNVVIAIGVRTRAYCQGTVGAIYVRCVSRTKDMRLRERCTALAAGWLAADL